MRNRIWKKLCSRRGDSLGETLVALLVGCLALVMLAGAITTSASLVTRSKDKIQEYYAANNAIVSGVSAKGPLQVSLGGDISQSLGSHSYYVNNTFGNTSVIAYH